MARKKKDLDMGIVGASGAIVGGSAVLGIGSSVVSGVGGSAAGLTAASQA